MNKEDLEHKLLKGSILYFEQVPTYSITLGQMAEFGFSRAQGIINLLCMEDSRAKEFLSADMEQAAFAFIYLLISEERKKITDGQIAGDMREDTLLYSIPAFLELLFKNKVVFDSDYGFVIGTDAGGKTIINDSNYAELRDILKERNCLADIDELTASDNPASGMVKQLLDKRKKLREKVRRAKKREGSDDGEPLTMADLISIFAQAQTMFLQDVYDRYDIYQFNNQFNRLKIMDDYHVSIQALLAGAKSEDVKLKHWLTKISKPDNSG